jgi:hypothetical protein
LTSAFDNAIDPIENTISGLIEEVNELLSLIDDIQVPDVDIPSGGGGGDSGSGSSGDSGSGSSGDSGSGSSGGLDSGFTDGRPGPSDEIGTPGYGGDGDDDVSVGLNRGGVIGATGLAMVHRGERIIPDAQVDERGRLDPSDVRGMSGGGGVQIENLTVNADSRSGGRAAGRALKRELKRFDI